MDDLITIERLTVRTGRLLCDVILASGCPRTTTPALSARVCKDFPLLPLHACVNDRGTTFSAAMDCTPLPHLLEHLVIDLQTHASADLPGPSDDGASATPPVEAPHAAPPQRRNSFATGRPRDRPYGESAPSRAATPAPPDDFAFVGTTEWTDEVAGRAHIEVNFADDLVALRAFRDAVAYLNKVMIP